VLSVGYLRLIILRKEWAMEYGLTLPPRTRSSRLDPISVLSSVNIHHKEAEIIKKLACLVSEAAFSHGISEKV
jgi:hypothetical protein